MKSSVVRRARRETRALGVGWSLDALRRRAGGAVTHGVLLAVSALMVAPYVWALSASVKNRAEIFTPVPQWWPTTWQWSNYADVFRYAPFGTYFVNTVVVVLGILGVQLITVTLAAFAFARMQFRFRELFFYLFVVQMMLPIHTVIVPNYLTIKSLGLLDTRLAMMLPFWASGYGTFLLRQAFRQIPLELEEAALIDGCTGLRLLWSIMLPLVRPTLVAFSLISIVTHWNDFLWPLIVTNTPAVRTLTIGLAMFVQQESGADWTLLMAATVLVTLPLLVAFVVFQRKFVESFMYAGLR
jgi:sn-glycerol 3-phosphate transport system permease protein